MNRITALSAVLGAAGCTVTSLLASVPPSAAQGGAQ
jgi:hypothetical protein